VIQRLSCLQRRPDRTREEFSRHWREVHGPLVARVPGLVRYCQNHVVDASQMVRHARGGAEVDGFAQLWFADAAAMRQSSSSPEYLAAFGDLVNFMGAMSHYAIETNPVMEKSTAGRGIKRMTLLYAKDGIDRAAFRRRWFDEHAAMVREFPGLRGYLQHLITDYATFPKGPVAEAGIRCAGILEMWFDDRAAMEEAFRSPEAGATIAHGDLFLGAATTYMVEEIEIV